MRASANLTDPNLDCHLTISGIRTSKSSAAGFAPALLRTLFLWLGPGLHAGSVRASKSARCWTCTGIDAWDAPALCFELWGQRVKLLAGLFHRLAPATFWKR